MAEQYCGSFPWPQRSAPLPAGEIFPHTKARGAVIMDTSLGGTHEHPVVLPARPSSFAPTRQVLFGITVARSRRPWRRWWAPRRWWPLPSPCPCSPCRSAWRGAPHQPHERPPSRDRAHTRKARFHAFSKAQGAMGLGSGWLWLPRPGHRGVYRGMGELQQLPGQRNQLWNPDKAARSSIGALIQR